MPRRSDIGRDAEDFVVSADKTLRLGSELGWSVGSGAAVHAPGPREGAFAFLSSALGGVIVQLYFFDDLFYWAADGPSSKEQLWTPEGGVKDFVNFGGDRTRGRRPRDRWEGVGVGGRRGGAARVSVQEGQARHRSFHARSGQALEAHSSDRPHRVGVTES